MRQTAQTYPKKHPEWCAVSFPNERSSHIMGASNFFILARLQRLGSLRIAENDPILHFNYTISFCCQTWVVCNKNNAASFLTIQARDEIEDFLTRFRIKVSRRLVSEQPVRFVDERPGNRHPLLLTARQLRRQRIHSLLQTNLFKQLLSAFLLIIWDSSREQRNHHIFKRSQRRQLKMPKTPR